MSVTRSSRAERWLLPGWVAFAVLNAALMLLFPEQETIPFHLIWISLSLVYGVRPWSHRITAGILVALLVFFSYSIGTSIVSAQVDWQELTEIPLMAMVFLAMLWHVQRREASQRQVEAMATSERRAHEVKELFVRHCSHEMRTPLAIARGYTELVQHDLVGQSRDDADVVLHELSRLDHLTGRLVTLAEAYQAHTFAADPVDLAVLVERTASRWSGSVDRDWVVDVEPVGVTGDYWRLETALDTLIDNAVKFTAPGDRITLRSTRRGKSAALEVQDTGVGISRSRDLTDLDKVSGRPGTGLGLSIVQAIADGHDGGLEVGDAVEGGTLASLRLPRPKTLAVHSAVGSPPSTRSATT